MTSPRITQEQRDAVNKYLDNHREDIRFAKKGYLASVMDGFESETKIHLSNCQFKKLLDEYRIKFNCPIEYVSNKYYTPKRRFATSRYVEAGSSPKQEEKISPALERAKMINKIMMTLKSLTYEQVKELMKYYDSITTSETLGKSD